MSAIRDAITSISQATEVSGKEEEKGTNQTAFIAIGAVALIVAGVLAYKAFKN